MQSKPMVGDIVIYHYFTNSDADQIASAPAVILEERGEDIYYVKIFGLKRNEFWAVTNGGHGFGHEQWTYKHERP